MTGAESIAAERRRQVESEGWTPEHDDEHTANELAWAAVCYAAPSRVTAVVTRVGPCGCREAFCQHPTGRVWRTDRCDPWPWDPKWDKRPQANEPITARIRALVKAGALIAAEIDRLRRVEGAPSGPDSKEGA